MFHSARWKAYLQNLQDEQEGEVENISTIENIYHMFHAQKIWFAREEKSHHQKAAEEHLRRSDELINDCTKQVEALEKTLANTPKPSEVLDWNNVTLRDMA